MNYKVNLTDSLYLAVLKAARQAPERVVVSFYGRDFTYGRMVELFDRAAGGLYDLGVREGDAVTICLPNTPAAAVALYAVNKLGAVANLVHPFIPPEQLTLSASKTNSRLIVAYDVYLAGGKPETNIPILQSKSDYYMSGPGKLAYRYINRRKRFANYPVFEALFDSEPYGPTADFGDDMPAVYLPSGGTTGKSKIIMHNNRAFNELCDKASYFLSADITAYRAMYSVLPVFHGFGLCMNLHMCMLMGIQNIMCMRFNAKSMAKALQKYKVGIITGVPTMYAKLLKEKKFLKARLPELKECFVGGDAVSDALVSAFNAQLKRAGSPGGMYIGYGLTETVTVCCVNTKEYHRAGSIGRPLPGIETAIVKDGSRLKAPEVGEICVKTPIIMLGYLGDGEGPIKEFEGASWLFTGDCGYADEDGYVYFKQRIKNMIKVSGVPVYPSEIEETVAKIAGVIHVCAVGTPDSIKGEVVKLYVETETGTDQARLKEEIEAVCRKKLIAYACPKQIIFKRLPVSSIGKIDRKALEQDEAEE